MQNPDSMFTKAEDELILNLWKETEKVKSAFRATHLGSIEISDSEIQRRRGENQPLLDLQKAKFETAVLNKLSLEFVTVLSRYEAFNQDEIKRFSEKVEKLNSAELTCLILHQDWQNLKSLSAQYQVSTELLLFIGINLSQAVLELYAKKLKPNIDQENWLLGNCPICGAFPAMQKLRKDDGKRILWCGLCGTEWQYKRIMCPFCGNEDHNSLRYFFVEGDPPEELSAFRVDVCDKCRRYIKTLDERTFRESDKVDLHVENLNTTYLDLLAQRDGYQSPTYWMLALS